MCTVCWGHSHIAVGTESQLKVAKVLDVLAGTAASNRAPAPDIDELYVEHDRQQTLLEVESVKREQLALGRRCWHPGVILHPRCAFKIAWDMFMMLLIVISVWAIPFRIGFEVPLTPALFWTDFTMDCIFFIDIVINFHTGWVFLLACRTLLPVM